MKRELHHIRRQYQNAGLIVSELPTDPLDLFDQWFEIQQTMNEYDPTAMTLSTVSLNGYPEARIVLLKEFSEAGFTFFTNYKSQKGVAIAMDNRVAILFYWPEQMRQVRIEGIAKKLSAVQSDKYFKERPFESQVSAVVSPQSQTIPSRDELENKYQALLLEHTNETLKRPENWGGYIVEPVSYEFWQGRENRLHDRVYYKKKASGWEKSRLAP